MNLRWPQFLLLLVLNPLLVAMYVWVQRRRRKPALRFSSLALIRPALPRQPRLLRHVPPTLFLLSLSSLAIAAARPVRTVKTPASLTSVILVIDVSDSMKSTDILPTRLAAAQAAALSFIQRQRTTTQVGIVSFSGDANQVLPPTTNRVALASAVESLTLGTRTAIGSGILKGLEAIAQVDGHIKPPDSEQALINGAPKVNHQTAFAPDMIILLTDGQNNGGPDPHTAAQEAEDRGVRVYTIGLGTANSQNGGPQSSIPVTGGNGNSSDRVDVLALKQIAAMTGGKFFTAASAGELQKVYTGLSTGEFVEQKMQETSPFFIVFGALLAAASMALSLLWQPLP